MIDFDKTQRSVEEFLKALGFDYGSDQHLKDTPRRVAKFWSEFLGNEDGMRLTTFDNEGYDELIIVKDIRFYSFCSHHLLPFFGEIHIGYLPAEKLCGASKLIRIVRKMASGLKVQEEMTNDIADYVYKNLRPQWCMVVVEAHHMCMSMRGVRDSNHRMMTSAVRGDADLKDEFLKLIGV